ncbi:MAG: 50S ribosomal protein L24 [Clostridia bacterium]
MNKVHVKKGDNVLVLNGKDRGKTGKIMETNPKKGTVMVEGVNISKRHVKPRKADQQGGIVSQESPMDASKVMLICPKCKKPSRVAKKVSDDMRKTRVCKKCNAVIDVIKEKE